MSDFAAVRSGLYSILTNVTGLSAGNVFKYAPNNAAMEPFAFISRGSGDISGGDGNPWLYSGFRETTHHPTVTVCFSLQSGIGDAEAQSDAFVDRIVDAIGLHQTLNGNVASASVVSYETAEVTLRAGDPTFYGLRFQLWIQEIESGTLTGA